MADVHRLPLPPHSVEAEQALLGSLILDAKAWPRVASQIVAADFYRADHRIIFAAIAALQDTRLAVDVVSITELLERLGTLSDAGGLAYIGRLARDTPSAENIETYAGLVRERSSLRRLKTIGEEIAGSACDAGERCAAELTASAQENLHRLQRCARTGKGLIGARQLVGELTDDLDARSAGRSVGLRVGLADFDDLTNGLEPGDLVVIAARPGMGKTALLVSIASLVSQTIVAAVFSAEMPSSQLMRRCVALQAEIPQGLLRRPEKLTRDDWSKIDKAAGTIAQRKLWIDDTGSPSLSHIRAEAIALKSRASIGLVLIDYVQLVRGPGANRYEQLRDVAYGLKALAKELAAPIIVLAQLNRGVESREHKRPHISDLRDSGAIEEAADIVGLLYSEGYYDREFSMPYVLECQIAKNRNGERGQCLWHFDGQYSRVVPLDPGAAANYRRVLTKAQQRASSDL
jgi:replicative DNA helicase